MDQSRPGAGERSRRARRPTRCAKTTRSTSHPAPLTPLAAAPEDIPLEILYEDSDLVAINKPAGMVVHAGAGVHPGRW